MASNTNLRFKSKTTSYPLDQADQTLADLHAGLFERAAVLVPSLASLFAPVNPYDPMTAVHQVEVAHAIARFSPNTLYGETMLALLNPATRTLGLVFVSQLEGAVLGAPLPFGQSLLLIWPQLCGLIAATILVYTLAYVIFLRQEIRA